MTTIGGTNLTLLDWARRLDPDGSIATVGELLSQTNEILTDAVFKESNQALGERVTIRTGLPASYWRAFGQGIPNSKSTTAQVDEGCGMLEARNAVDVDVAKLNGNTAEFRMSEDRPFIESMNQTMAKTMFYGNPTITPTQFLGLAPRYSDGLGPANAQNVINGGGSGADNTSIWLVVWSTDTVYCTFPKGSQAGLVHNDLGQQTVPDETGRRYEAYESHYQWKNGLVVKDWRYAVRICNIDVSDLVGTTGTQATTAATNLIRLMFKAIARIPNLRMGKAAFYMNRSAYEGLALLAFEKTSSVLKIVEGLNQFGSPDNWMTFMGVPLRKSDALLNAEALVSFS